MSTSQHETTTDAQSDDHDDGPDRHPNYEETTRSAYSANRKARAAFRDWRIKPSVTRRSSKLGKRFTETAYHHYGSSLHAYQFPNGVGFCERTNRQSRGGFSLRLPDGDTLAGLTVDQLYNFLATTGTGLGPEEGRGLSDLVAQHGATNDYGRVDSQENFLLEFRDGSYLVVLYDASANRRARTSARYAGLLVERDDPRYAHVQQLHARDAYAELADLVAPDEVLASDLPVVDSSTYRNPDGRGADNIDGYGDEALVGSRIIRQGEWYFISKPDLELPRGRVQKPLSEYVPDNPLGNHTPRDLVVIGEDEDLGTFGDGPEPGVYVRGTVRHADNEHSMFNLYETWHQVVENTEDLYAFTSSGGRME